MSPSNETTTSSPDPLGMSHDNLGLSSPLRQQRETPNLSPKKVLGESSDNVRLHDIYLTTSPAARNYSTTPTKGSAHAPTSPWRIHVIVEAEHENGYHDNSDAYQPLCQPSKGRTTTTMIPLKGAEDSVVDSPKRNERQRKSLNRTGKGARTPKATSSGRRDSMRLSPEKRIYDDVSHMAATPKRGRGRPRKSVRGLSDVLGVDSANLSNTVHVSPLGDLGDLGMLGEFTEPRCRGRRTVPTPIKRVTSSDTVRQESAQGIHAKLRMNEKGAIPEQATGTKRKMDTVIGPERPQRIKRSHAVMLSPQRGLSELAETREPASGIAKASPTSHWLHNREHMLSQGNTKVSGSSHAPEVELDRHLTNQEVRNLNTDKIRHSSSASSHPLSDPINEHHEFDSMLESEGFSMVSISSLPSGKIGLHIASQDFQDGEGDHHLETDLEECNSHSQFPSDLHQSSDPKAHGGSRVHSEGKKVVPPSFVRDIERLISDHTPSPNLLEPSKPPPLQPRDSHNLPRVLDEATENTPKIARVVRAGTALQGVMEPKELANLPGKGTSQAFESSESSEGAPIEGPKDLFDGFGAGTQRELRAGLRLGEELAKRLPSTASGGNTLAHDKKSEKGESSSTRETSEYSIPNPGSEPVISYPAIFNPQLPSPERSEISGHENQTRLDVEAPAQSEGILGMNRDSQGPEIVEDARYSFHNTTIEREAEWQREREAVVRQIETANASRVIIIDGDTELDERRIKEEVMEETDIWQAAAGSSHADLSFSYEQSGSIIQTQTFKSRRSRIPSPWRRQDQLGPTVQGDAGSDLFWQPGRANSAGVGGEIKHDSSSRPAKPNDAARREEVLGSRRSSKPDNDSGPIRGHSLHPTSVSSIKNSVSSSQHELLVNQSDDRYSEMQSSLVIESIEKDQPRACNDVDTRSNGSSQGSRRRTSGTNIPKPHSQPRTRPASQAVATTKSISWFSYIASFVPGWGPPDPPKPLPRLPNGQRRLPVAISEGPLSLYLPWTLDHWKALYVHYAAVREGRVRVGFNLFSPTAIHIGVSHRYRHWQKAITAEDSAIADAFLKDLWHRGVGKPAHDSMPIDDYVVLGKIFFLWKAGVMNGECEVGIGKTGWATGSEEWWRPDMESWYWRRKRQDQIAHESNREARK